MHLNFHDHDFESTLFASETVSAFNIDSLCDFLSKNNDISPAVPLNGRHDDEQI